MPIIKTVCPHCEKNVEFNVTSVTRSRACTHCGKQILLQLSSKTKRKALLVPAPAAEEPLDPSKPEPDVVIPKVLEGDIRRRMLHDPEVLASMQQLRWGIGIVGTLIVLAAFLSYVNAWNRLSDYIAGPSKRIPLPETPDFLADMKASLPKPNTVLPQGPTAGAPEAVSAPATEGELAAAMQAAASFLGAKSASERFKTIRDQKLLKEKFHKYYETHPDGPIPFERVEPHSTNPEGPMTFSFIVVLPGGTKQTLCVGKANSGSYMVDWASFVHYGDMELGEFKAKRPTEPVLFRMLASAESFYGGSFGDAKGLVCVKLQDPRSPNGSAFYGYVERSSTLGRSIDFLMRKALGEQVPIIAMLKYPENSQSDDQVWIHELVSEGWVARGK